MESGLKSESQFPQPPHGRGIAAVESEEPAMVGVFLRRVAVPLLVCLASVGCGGEPDQPNVPNTPPPPSGGPRLLWSQLGPGSGLANYSFNLFVDDSRFATLAANCTPSSAS